MHKRVVLSASAVGVVAAFLAAPVASAKPILDDFLGLGPSSGLRPGDSAEVFGVCNEPGFTSRALESSVLEPTKVSLNVDGEAPSVSGRAQVRKDAKPGRYTVSFKCSGVPVTATIVIVGDKKRPTTTTPAPSGQVKVKPKGAADTGGGGATVAAPGEAPSNGGAEAFLLGGAVLGVTGAAGLLLYRRLRKEN